MALTLTVECRLVPFIDGRYSVADSDLVSVIPCSNDQDAVTIARGFVRERKPRHNISSIPLAVVLRDGELVYSVRRVEARTGIVEKRYRA